MFTAALSTTAKTWKQPKCPSTEEWIKKMGYIYTMEYCSAINKNEIMPFAATWMYLTQFSSVTQLCLTLCDRMNHSTPGPLSITNSRSLPKPMSIESVTPSNHLILCRPLLLLPSIFPSLFQRCCPGQCKQTQCGTPEMRPSRTSLQGCWQTSCGPESPSRVQERRLREVDKTRDSSAKEMEAGGRGDGKGRNRAPGDGRGSLMRKGPGAGWLQGHVWKQSESQGSATRHCY